MDYLMISVSILAAVFNSVLLHKEENKTNPFFFNGICSAVWIVLLLFMNGFRVHIDRNTLMYGIMYGVVQLLFLFFKLKAMANGPVSVITLIGNCSMIISAAAGVIFWKESVSIFQILGMVLLLAGIFICSDISNGGAYKPSLKYYAAGFFCLAGAVGIVFKVFFAASGGQYCGDMLIVAAVFMTVCNLLLSAKHIRKMSRKELGLSLLCGSASCIYNRLNIYLAGALPSIIFFPAFNGSVIILSVISGVLICGEKLTVRQIIGFCIGAAAIIIIGTT